MPDTRITAQAARLQSTLEWTAANLGQATRGSLSQAGAAVAQVSAWAGNTAQEFGGVLSALLGPIVLLAYALAVWSLTSNLGWTDSFIFSSGPLSSWLVWLALAATVNVACKVLARRTHRDRD